MVGAKIANLQHGQKKADVEISTSQSDAGKLLNISRESIISARKVQEKAAPEVIREDIVDAFSSMLQGTTRDSGQTGDALYPSGGIGEKMGEN